MSIQSTSELIETKNRIRKIEMELETILRKIEQKEKIDFVRTKDYGKKNIVLNIFIDSFNISFFNDENINRIKLLYNEFENLRKLQKKLEDEYYQESSVNGILGESIRRSNW